MSEWSTTAGMRVLALGGVLGAVLLGTSPVAATTTPEPVAVSEPVEASEPMAVSEPVEASEPVTDAEDEEQTTSTAGKTATQMNYHSSSKTTQSGNLHISKRNCVDVRFRPFKESKKQDCTVGSIRPTG
ncbi:hypothetical protein [Thermomonospora umbrina]|uniref:Uncharacterized protein n=1 Tax=Thermomonospora umbrina TaxID=111806 RepID=A0A3D9STW4_9ACTN|nr:hypothetical protein [Thermomonospora umbrina]REE99396.1 hypothetical protein DFJ69_4908 [Thermomonospora umbrina]